MPQEVRVVRVPGAIQTVMLEDGLTVKDALSAANTEVSSEEAMKLNGNDCSVTDLVKDGDRIIISKGAKGN